MPSVDKENRPPIGFNLNDFNSTTILTEKGKNADEENYNPFEHRDMEHANSTSGSLVHLLKSSLGTGVLAMPMAFRNSGTLVGAVGTLVIGFICTYCVHILVKTSNDVCKKAKIPALGFAETAGKVFECGPPMARRWSNFAQSFCDYGLLATYLSANCVYIVFIATSIQKVVYGTLHYDIDVRLFIAAVVIPCILLGQIRQLKYLVPFSALANLFMVITFAITFYYMFSGPLEISERPLFSSWGQLPLFFSTVIFSMEGIGVVMPVENTMKKPQHFLGCPGVLNTAMITIVVLYGVIGFFGYARYGENVAAIVTLNLPQEDVVAHVAQVLIAIAILLTFGLQFYVPCDILWRKLSVRIPKERHNMSQILLRTGLVLMMGGVAAAVPDLEPFIGLVGSIFFSILGLFVPAAIQTVFLYPDGFGFAKWKLWKNVFLMVVAIIALVTGSYTSILKIIEFYNTPNH